MVDPMVAIGFMALAFGFHIVLVNIDMGLAIIIPILKRIGESKGMDIYVNEARRYMRYFAIIYASAGVFGTAFTVFLLSFFPQFLWLGGLALLIPFGLAGLFLAIRLFSISAYWYTWDKLSSQYHFILGLILASTSFLVPLMFRTVFAFLNVPVGVESLEPLKLNWLKMFQNPTLIPLYLKSIAGAIAATFFMLVSIHTYRLYRGKGSKDSDELFARKYIYAGSWFLFMELVFGFWYLASISAVSPFKFSNIAGAWFGVNPAESDYSWLFLVKLVSVGYQFFVILYLLQLGLISGKINMDDSIVQKLLIPLGPAACLTIVLGEYLNAFSQLPYFIAIPELEKTLPMINVYTSINPLAALFDIYVITVFAITPLLLAFFVLLYFLLSGRIES